MESGPRHARVAGDLRRGLASVHEAYSASDRGVSKTLAPTTKV